MWRPELRNLHLKETILPTGEDTGRAVLQRMGCVLPQFSSLTPLEVAGRSWHEAVTSSGSKVAQERVSNAKPRIEFHVTGGIDHDVFIRVKSVC